MYPSRFRYEAPRSLGEAIALLRDGGEDAKVLAGGQSLVPLMKLRFASPELIVDINNVPDLAYHRADPDGTLRVGALCRHAELERSGLLRDTQPTIFARCIGGNIGHDGRYTNMSDDQVGADTPALQQNGAVDPYRKSDSLNSKLSIGLPKRPFTLGPHFTVRP